MDALHAAWPNKRLLATESCICPNVHLDDWARGEQYLSAIINDLNHWSVGWTDWNLLLSNQGGPTHVHSRNLNPPTPPPPAWTSPALICSPAVCRVCRWVRAVTARSSLGSIWTLSSSTTSPCTTRWGT